MKSNKWLIWGVIFTGVVAIGVVLFLTFFNKPKPVAEVENIVETETTEATIETETAQTTEPAETMEPTPSKPGVERAMDAYSVDRAISFLTELTSIAPHSGWRGGGTAGENQAFNLVASEIEKMDWLKTQGINVEREEFNIFVGTQDHTTSVSLTAGNKTLEVAADSPRGHRDNPEFSSHMDSDGALTDNNSNPVQISGEVVWIPAIETLSDLQSTDLAGKVALVNYHLVDNSLKMNVSAGEAADMILSLKPAAIILYTQYDNINGGSHGTYLGDGAGGFQTRSWEGRLPILFIQMEDLMELGISEQEQLEQVTHAEIVWDVDVTNPARSQNLIVHVPGKSGGKSVLLSAHLDSANSPGALDDGSGSAVLMEILTVLNEQHIQPETDLYLAWYGSEEILLYGSGYFTTTHSELINQLQANIQMDCLLQPLDDVPAGIEMVFSNYITPTLEEDPLVKYLQGSAEKLGIQADLNFQPFDSDNGSLSAFNVSNLNLIYLDQEMYQIDGGPWYAGHLHDPYDTIDRVITMKDVYEEMGKLVLSVAFIPSDEETFVKKEYTKSALFMSSHTEAATLTPMGLPYFSQNLIDLGYEVNVLPFGQPLESSDLTDLDLLVVLPTYDYPINDETGAYDAAITPAEAALINDYANSGGTVLVANSATRLKLFSWLADANEDWSDLNTLTDQWDVHFAQAGTNIDELQAELNQDIFTMKMIPDNAVPFTAPADAVLAGAGDLAYLAGLPVGKGKVIIISDLSMLGENTEGPINPRLVENLMAVIAK